MIAVATRIRTVAPLFTLLARGYDVALLQRVNYRPGQDEVIGELRAAGSRRVADIACGTGILAARIEAELCPDEVHGFDLSTGMLAKAHDRSATVRWTVASATQLPLEDGALDAVTCTAAFHFFDQSAALTEFLRVLAPGGVAVVTTFTSPAGWLSRVSAALGRWLLGTGRFPTSDEVLDEFVRGGFEQIVQRRVRRPGLLRVIPEYVTVGVRSME